MYVVPLNTEFVIKVFFQIVRKIFFNYLFQFVSLTTCTICISFSLFLFTFNISLSNFFKMCGLVAFLEFGLMITISLEADSVEAEVCLHIPKDLSHPVCSLNLSGVFYLLLLFIISPSCLFV